MSIEVVEPGLLSSIQDPLGRREWRHVGVPSGGAADPWNARLANRLVGNADGAALIEMTLIGPALRLGVAATVAITGGLEATLDGVPLPPNAAQAIRAGSLVRVGSGGGARGYLAFGGGLEADEVLGSASTDLRTGFGGLGGRALEAGDRLQLGAPPAGPGSLWTGSWAAGPIRIVDGPHADRFAPGALAGGRWRVGVEADRSGVRLDGPAPATDVPQVPSIGLPPGAVQVPPDGRPIVMLADRPVTGGYPVPAVVIGADVGRVAQLRTGDEIRFASVSLDEAREAVRQAEDELAALETRDGPRDDGLGWAGSHR
ncbi:MAG TPA: biotin-dependent carboxyltransferase family protein [Candidatus Binatia bacterium]|nr:biotin-dependent carboxyltransferase family protein [Candidatus Binatia bacterium]